MTFTQDDYILLWRRLKMVSPENLVRILALVEECMPPPLEPIRTPIGALPKVVPVETSISVLDLGKRICDALEDAGVITIERVCDHTKETLCEIKGIGEFAVDVICRSLKFHGKTLRPSVRGDFLPKSVMRLELMFGLATRLSNGGVINMERLLKLTPEQVLAIPGVTKDNVLNIQMRLLAHGYTLRVYS